MKNIPYSLQQKLKETVWAGKAQPDIQVIATQSSVNTLISEIIHKNIPGNFGDIAVRQLEGERHPSLAYALCIDNGIAEFWQRKMPAEYDYPWIKDWTFGEAKEVAIEFNGAWTLDSRKMWYYLKTERYPYIFWVDNASQLFVQHWNNDESKILLDTNVTQISVCRGWNSDESPALDQGMVIGYIKTDTKVYYRAWCTQEDGTRKWEIYQEVTELGTGNTYLQVFRTNDFRLGFAVENKGEMIYILTNRNYAGQSVRPEGVNAQICEIPEIDLIEIKKKDVIAQDETVSGVLNTEDVVFLYYPVGTDFTFAIIETKRIGDYQLEARASHQLKLLYPVENFVNITPNTVQSVEVNGDRLLITANEKIQKIREVNAVITESPGIRYKVLPYCMPEVPQTTINFKGEFPETNESIRFGRIDITNLDVIEIKYSDAPPYIEDFALNANFIIDVLDVIQVGEFPV